MAKQLNHKPDPFQQQAIDSTARGIRIVAPAGSGKSETLARRVAKRIERDGVDPKRILVLTFDKAGQNTLKRFLSSYTHTKEVEILTYDTFGKNVLEEFFPPKSSGVECWVSSTKSDSPDRIVRDIRQHYYLQIDRLSVMRWDGDVRLAKDLIPKIKNEGFDLRAIDEIRDDEFRKKANRRNDDSLVKDHYSQTKKLKKWLAEEVFRIPNSLNETSADPDQAESTISSPYLQSLHGDIDHLMRLVSGYDKEMILQKRRDLEDRKLLAANLLRCDDSATEELKKSYTDVILDEAQDISRVDAMLAWLASSHSPDSSVVITGDDDQTIYSFRNASAKYLKDPQLVFGEERVFEDYSLQFNYRCPQTIIDCAQQLIQNNVKRIHKTSTSRVSDTEGTVSLHRATDKQDHDHQLVDTVKAYLGEGYKPEDIAMICGRHRGQWPTKSIRDLLEEADIRAANTSDDGSKQNGRVWVGTINRSKGQQWPIVLMPYLDFGSLPDKRKLNREDVEAERRLLYVSMTRASRDLNLFYTSVEPIDACKRDQQGNIIWTNGASPFLFEAGLIGESDPSTRLEEESLLGGSESIETPTSSPSIYTKPTILENEGYPTSIRRTGRTIAVTRKTHSQEVREIWHTLEKHLRAAATHHLSSGADKPAKIINDLHRLGLLDSKWRERLHKWRVARNHWEHYLLEYGDATLSKNTLHRNSENLIEYRHNAELHLQTLATEPRRTEGSASYAFTKQREVVYRLEERWSEPTSTQMERIPQRVETTDELLGIQLHLLLLDIPFSVPLEYRWSSVVEFWEFVSSKGIPVKDYKLDKRRKILSDGNSSLLPLTTLLEETLQAELGDSPKSIEELSEAIKIGYAKRNGELADGVVIIPTF